MEDENFWGFVDLDYFCCAFVLFAIGAVPLIAFLELLLFAEVEEAISQLNSSILGAVF
jgi:hypothetical protein